MTVFSKIISGEMSSYKILEDGLFYAFLDINPIARGHVLVVPKLEVDKFFDLPKDILSEMLIFAKPIADAIEKVFDCKRVAISVVGLEVPHAHMHLIPINHVEDVNFAKEKYHLTKEEFEAIQNSIVKKLKETN
jgi:histidine triad (HIT) family protein